MDARQAKTDIAVLRKGRKMSDLNHDLYARAVKALSENEVQKMEHCIGLGITYDD
jgi:hypothetical protein